MTRWLTKFEVQAHAGLKEGVNELSFKHPSGKYEIFLQNYKMEIGTKYPLLFAYVIHNEAEDIKIAMDIAASYLWDFIDILGFSTGLLIQMHREVAIYDWTSGNNERNGRVFSDIENPNFPSLFIDVEHKKTVETLFQSTNNEFLRRAFRWYRMAVSSKEPDSQFHWFWFVIEIIAQMSLIKEKVADQCPKCHEPLYCNKCNEIPTHRPYPNQEIKKLFFTYVQDKPESAFNAATAMRHALSHGGSSRDVEKEYNVSINDLVDFVGNVAWSSLFDALKPFISSPDEIKNLELKRPLSFIHFNLGLFVGFSMHSTVQEIFSVDSFPNVTLG